MIANVQSEEGIVELVDANGSGVSGTIFLEQEGHEVKVHGVVFGLKGGEHGFQVHAVGATGNNCKDAGGHFNPFEKNHGAPDSEERHVGDLGNILVPDDEHETHIMIIDDVINIEDLDSPANILGKAIVIHEGVDDLGLGGNEESLITGNAGA